MINCPQCNGTGWIEGDGGMKRCPCRQNIANGTPQRLTLREKAELAIAATKASHKLGAMPDYPHALDEEARGGVADQLAAMCSTPEQVDWICQRALTLFRSWKECGPSGLRQILVSKFRARDGTETGPPAISKGYPEGIPSEQDGLTGYQIASGISTKFLTAPGEPTSKDGLLAPAVQDVAKQKRIPMPAHALPPEKRPRLAMPKLPPPEPPPIPPGKEITQADIEAELKKKGKSA